jgi:predicted amidohydrolase
VDPWGAVVAQCKEGTDLAVGEVDLDYLKRIREEMPVWNHRRHDLYSKVLPLQITSGIGIQQ